MLTGKIPGTIRCGKHLLDLSSPVVMGILNITPDSFYPPSRITQETERILEVARQMIADGAKILDIGGMSSRPGAREIESREEMDRVLPAVEALYSSFPDTIISIDTYRAEVASQAIEKGAGMVNDISGGSLDPGMINVLASGDAAYVLMHMRGKPSDMHTFTDYLDLMGDMVKYFVNKLKMLHQRDIHEIIIDPGFGFSKTMDQNFQIVNKLEILKILECPIMIGLSRKSSLSEAVGKPVEDTLDATTALHMMALHHGASILRVHDVSPAKDAIAIFTKLQGVKNH